MAFVAALTACGRAAPGGSEAARPRAAVVLVGIGASDAVGIGAANPDQDNWVARLGASLPSGSRVVNLGISGATAAQAATQELPVALDAAPTDVAVWLGVNDVAGGVSLDGFTGSLRQIVTALRTRTWARVYVGNLPDLTRLGAFGRFDPAALAATVSLWNEAIAGICTESGARLVDVYSAWKELPDSAVLVSADGLHPTTAGYQRIADLFRRTMHQAG